MSGIRTSQPVALIRSGNGLDIECFASELDCVLYFINNGALAKGIDANAIGWGSPAHKVALDRVAKEVKKALKDIVAQDKREAKLYGSDSGTTGSAP